MTARTRMWLGLAALAWMMVGSRPAPAQDADPAFRRLQPFMDQQLLGVARIDLPRVPLDSLAQQLGQMLGADPETPLVPREVMTWIPQALEAGIREIDLIFRLEDFPNGPVMVVVPKPPKADADAIQRVLRQFASGATIRDQGGQFVMGSPKPLEALKDLKPVDRPGFREALAAVKSAPVQVVFVPSADVRKVMGEVMPSWPRELGGQPSMAVTQGLQWIALGVEVQPKLAMTVVAQSADAAAAQSLAGVVTAGLQWLGGQKEFTEMVPGAQRLLARLKPAVQETRVSLALSLADEDVKAATGAMAEKALLTSRRRQSMNNLKQMALAWHMSHDAFNRFPDNLRDKGKPMLSWRVHLLPFIEENELYKQFKLDEPWDSPNNKALIAKMPKVYRSPLSKAAAGHTNYLAPTGFADDKKAVALGMLGASLRAITDGTSNSIMLVEVDDAAAVPWTQPDDLAVDSKNPRKHLAGLHPDGFLAAFGDGSVRFLRKTITPQTLLSLFTRNGGEVINPNDL